MCEICEDIQSRTKILYSFMNFAEKYHLFYKNFWVFFLERQDKTLWFSLLRWSCYSNKLAWTSDLYYRPFSGKNSKNRFTLKILLQHKHLRYIFLSDTGKIHKLIHSEDISEVILAGSTLCTEFPNNPLVISHSVRREKFCKILSNCQTVR